MAGENDETVKAQLEKFLGTWRLVKSENFEEYMKAVEVGFLMRKLGSTAKPDVIISVENGEVVIKSQTTLKTHVTKFKLDVEFDEETVDGRKSKTVISMKDGKLVQVQGGSSVVPSTITRELTADELVCTCEAKGVISVRTYKRV